MKDSNIKQTKKTPKEGRQETRGRKPNGPSNRQHVWIRLSPEMIELLRLLKTDRDESTGEIIDSVLLTKVKSKINDDGSYTHTLKLSKETKSSVTNDQSTIGSAYNAQLPSVKLSPLQKALSK